MALPCCRRAPRAAWWSLTRHMGSPTNVNGSRATLVAANRKWAHGVTVIRYPLKDRATYARWKDALRKLGIAKLLCVAHWLYDANQPGIYNGAGQLTVNRPTPLRRCCRRFWKLCAPRWRRKGIAARSRPSAVPLEQDPIAVTDRLTSKGCL